MKCDKCDWTAEHSHYPTLTFNDTPPSKPKRKRATRKALPRDRAVSICATCGELFTTDAAEVRHLVATNHRRYLSITSTDETNT